MWLVEVAFGLAVLVLSGVLMYAVGTEHYWMLVVGGTAFMFIVVPTVCALLWGRNSN